MTMSLFGAHMRMWSRSELRRRWLSLALLGVLGGLAAGLAMAAYDGAARSSTAYERMREQLHGADAIIFPSQIGIGDFDPTALSDLPEVESWGGFSLNNSTIDGFPPYVSPFILSGDWFSTLEGAKVVQGRAPDPSRDDEAVITAPVLKFEPDFKVGTKLTWRNLSLAQAAQFPDGLPDDFDWTTAEGVVTELTVVGVVRLPMESVVSFANEGLLLTSPGWADAHLAETPTYFTNALVRLRHGAADLPALSADIERLTGRDDIPVKDLSTDIKRVQRSLDLQHTALLMFSAAIAITALVLVGQAVVRATSSGVASVEPLRAMGASGASLAVGLAAPMVVTIVVTVVAAAVVSIVASRWFPVGLARAVDPISGIHVALGRELVGLSITAVVVVALVVGSSVMLQRQVRWKHVPRTRMMSIATHAGMPVPPAIGASLAVDTWPGQGGRSRLALVAAVAGVTAVIGALTLVHGINDIVGHPERTGAAWDVVVDGYGNPDEAAELIDTDPDAADFAFMGRVPTLVDGADVPIYTLDVRKGSMDFTVVRGRRPEGNDEIALGPATMRLLDADIGSTVHVGPDATAMRVVGVTLLAQTPHSAFDEGGWVAQPAFEGMVDQAAPSGNYEEALITFVRGVDADSAIGRLPAIWQSSPPSDSPDLSNLLQVRQLPILLAVFLALLAVGAVAHALFTSARQRTRELAVLRALGLTGRQAAACVSWQAVATGTVAVIVGTPLGVILGQRMWRAITDRLFFVYVRPLASVPLAVAVPACLIGCVVLAIVPARRASRRRIADTLRQE